MAPDSTRCPPNHSTATEPTLATSITTGNIPACQRPARTATTVSSSLAFAKRCVSCSSRTKARTTRTPVTCSRSTRLTSSMRSCITRKLGTICRTISPTDRASTGTTSTMSHESPTSSRMAITTAPTIMIGAATNIVKPISTSICTCWTSLVSRVMSEGAPKCWTSRAEKVPTRWKMAARRSRPNDIAVRAANHTAVTAHSAWAMDTASMTAPRWTMKPVSPTTTPSSMIWALRLGR